MPVELSAFGAIPWHSIEFENFTLSSTSVAPIMDGEVEGDALTTIFTYTERCKK